MYTAFITDVFSHRIVGWALVRFDADRGITFAKLNQAIACAKETTGLIHHSDHGSQYLSIVYNQRLAKQKIATPTGRVGESSDNALAGNVNGSYKRMSSFIPRRGITLSTWKSRHLNGVLGGMRPEFIKDWATAHQLEWNQNFARPTRAKK